MSRRQAHAAEQAAHARHSEASAKGQEGVLEGDHVASLAIVLLASLRLLLLLRLLSVRSMVPRQTCSCFTDIMVTFLICMNTFRSNAGRNLCC
jgi:hypothetical protein